MLLVAAVMLVTLPLAWLLGVTCIRP